MVGAIFIWKCPLRCIYLLISGFREEKIYCLTLSFRKSTYPFLADGNKAENNAFRFYFVGAV